MDQKQIMVFCKHTAILHTIIRLINQHVQWQGIPVEDISTAMEIYTIRPIDLILLGAGLQAAEESAIKIHCHNTPCIQHYGGGSGLLYAEIQQALK